MIMFRNSKGQKDSMFTFAVLGFWITVFTILAPMIFPITIHGVKLEVSAPDAAIVTLFFAGTVSAYVWRRNKKDEFEHLEKMKKLEMGILE